MEIKLAIFSGLAEQRQEIQEQLAPFGDFNIVFSGKNLRSASAYWRKARPDIFLIQTGTPDNFHYDLRPDFPSVRNALPSAKITLRTELSQNHEFIQRAIKNGVSIIDERTEWRNVAGVLIQVSTGEQVVRYEQRKFDLESSPPRGYPTGRRGKER
jgi:uncharacterized protein Usg